MCLKYIEQNLRFLKWWEWHMEGHVSKHLPCCRVFNICTSGWEKDWCPSCWAFYKYDLLVCQLDGSWELSETCHHSHPLYFFFYFLFLFLLLACCVGCSPVPHAVLLLSPSAGLLPAWLIHRVSLGFDVNSPSRVSLFCLVIFIICSVPREILISEYYAFHSDCLAAISLWS